MSRKFNIFKRKKQALYPYGSDSATLSKKAQFLLMGQILNIRSFGLKKIQTVFLTKRGLFSQKGILFHNKSRHRKV